MPCVKIQILAKKVPILHIFGMPLGARYLDITKVPALPLEAGSGWRGGENMLTLHLQPLQRALGCYLRFRTLAGYTYTQSQISPK